MSSFSKCVVCTDPESEGNRVLSCYLCSVRVHQMCYGVKTYKERWKCTPCMSKTTGSRDPNCELCLQYGGAFKKTSNGSWVHVVCGLFIQGVEFVNKDKMQPINISKIPVECRGKMCDFCLNDGVCCLCSAPDCNRWVHATCAQKHASTKELTDKKSMITFLAYCENHTPSHRRISSIFVRDKLKEKSNDAESHQEEFTTIHDNNGQGQSIEIEEASNANNFPNDSVASQVIAEEELTTTHENSNSNNEQEQSIEIVEASIASNFSNDSVASQASTSSSESVASYVADIPRNVSVHNESSDHSNQSNVTKDSNVSDIPDTSGLDNAGSNDNTNEHTANASNIDNNESDKTTEVSNSIGTSEADDIPNDSMDAPEYWWDHQELLIQLHSKDEKIMKVRKSIGKVQISCCNCRQFYSFTLLHLLINC